MTAGHLAESQRFRGVFRWFADS